MLDKSDKKEMKEMISEALFEVIEEFVSPRFHEIEVKLDTLEMKVDENANVSNEKFGQLFQLAESLDSDMGGVKMRLVSIEKKLDDRTDTYLVVKDHEKRIKKLEKITA